MSDPFDDALAGMQRDAEAARDGLLEQRLEARRQLEAATDPGHRAEAERLVAYFDEHVALCQELIGLYRSMRDGWVRAQEIGRRMSEGFDG